MRKAKLYLYLIFMICINILSIIGLIFITKFSFKATRNKDTYTVNLEEWEYNFTRVTLVFLWISILSKALLILAIGFLLFIPFINLIIAGIMALLVIDNGFKSLLINTSISTATHAILASVSSFTLFVGSELYSSCFLANRL